MHKIPKQRFLRANKQQWRPLDAVAIAVYNFIPLLFFGCIGCRIDCRSLSYCSLNHWLRGIRFAVKVSRLSLSRRFGEECQERWGITPLQIFLHKDEGHWLAGEPSQTIRRVFKSVVVDSNPIITLISFSIG